jgi:hypothetical protein
MKQLDQKRREHRAELHIKQRDSIIEQLKEQVQLRDRIIKDKFGESVGKFVSQGALGATFYRTATKGEFLALADIERIATQVQALPSLQNTRTSSFA